MLFGGRKYQIVLSALKEELGMNFTLQKIFCNQIATIVNKDIDLLKVEKGIKIWKGRPLH